MSDYIHFNSIELADTIWVNKLIAFFINEGTAIFEGYCRVKKENLPHVVDVYRTQPNFENIVAMFKIKITEIYKKDLEPPKSEIEAKASHNCDPDECGCCISFFPRDIMILKFEILQYDNRHPSINWNFCLDSRFEGPSELIKRYLDLLELPDDPYESYSPLAADEEFYEEYHKVIEKGVNMYEAALLMEHAKIETNHSKLLRVIDEWNEMLKKISGGISSTYGNKALLNDSMIFLNFIESQIPFMQQWCSEYYCNMALNDKLRGWLTYGIRIPKFIPMNSRQYCKTRIPDGGEELLSTFEKHWQLFFRKGGDEADIITLYDKEFDISYRHYLKLWEDMRKEKEFDNCDMPEILDIHEDKSCYGGLICGLCDDQQCMWEDAVKKKYRSMNNIFINDDCAKEFIEKWITAASALPPSDRKTIHYIWPPKQPYIIEKSYNSCEFILSADEFIFKIMRSRKELYYIPGPTRPKVEFELLNDFRRALDIYKLPRFRDGENKTNEIFLSSYHLLTFLPYILYIDKKRCNELISIFASLADE
jgi:hypothetical protein